MKVMSIATVLCAALAGSQAQAGNHGFHGGHGSFHSAGYYGGHPHVRFGVFIGPPVFWPWYYPPAYYYPPPAYYYPPPYYAPAATYPAPQSPPAMVIPMARGDWRGLVAVPA